MLQKELALTEPFSDYYYFITTLYPGIKLWWKKYLTTLQISQVRFSFSVTFVNPQQRLSICLSPPLLFVSFGLSVCH